ncbi:hypothetical protein D3C86_1208250 [compost metagenome]
MIVIESRRFGRIAEIIIRNNSHFAGSGCLRTIQCFRYNDFFYRWLFNIRIVQAGPNKIIVTGDVINSKYRASFNGNLSRIVRNSQLLHFVDRLAQVIMCRMYNVAFENQSFSVIF